MNVSKHLKSLIISSSSSRFCFPYSTPSIQKNFSSISNPSYSLFRSGSSRSPSNSNSSFPSHSPSSLSSSSIGSSSSVSRSNTNDENNNDMISLLKQVSAPLEEWKTELKSLSNDFSKMFSCYHDMKLAGIVDLETFEMILKEAVRIGDRRTLVVLRDMENAAIIFNTFIYNQLIDYYFKVGDYPKMMENYHNMIENKVPCDSLTISKLLSALANPSLSKKDMQQTSTDIWKLYEQVPAKDLPVSAFNSLLLVFSQIEDSESVERVLQEMKKNSIHIGSDANQVLIKAYCRLNKITEAEKIIEDLSKKQRRITSFMYSHLMKHYALSDPERVIKYFEDAKSKGVKPQAAMYEPLFESLIFTPTGANFPAIFKHLKVIERNQTEINIRIFNLILKAFTMPSRSWIKAKRGEEMDHWIAKLGKYKLKPNIETYNTILIGLSLYQKIDKMIVCIQKMEGKADPPPDIHSYTILLNCLLTYSEDIKTIDKYTLKLEKFIQKKKNYSSSSSLQLSVDTYHTLMKSYIRSRKLDLLKKIFEEMEQKENIQLGSEITWINPPLTYYLMIYGYSSNGERKGMEYYFQSLNNKFGNSKTDLPYAFLAEGYSRVNQFNKSIDQVRRMKENKIQPTDFFWSYLLTAAGWEKNIKEVDRVWKMTGEEDKNIPNLELYAELIAAYARCNGWKKISDVFNHFQTNRLQPSTKMYSAFLRGLSKVTGLPIQLREEVSSVIKLFPHPKKLYFQFPVDSNTDTNGEGEASLMTSLTDRCHRLIEAAAFRGK